MAEPERGRLGRNEGSADIVGRRERQDLVDDADAVEADHHRQPAGHRRRLVAANILQPAHIMLDVDPCCLQRVQGLVSRPAQEDLEVGVRVHSRLAAVPAEVRSDGGRQELWVEEATLGWSEAEIVIPLASTGRRRP